MTCFCLKLPPHNLLPLPSAFLRRISYTCCFQSNTEEVLSAFSVIGPHNSSETSCTLKVHQAGPFVIIREIQYAEEVKSSLPILCNNYSMLDPGYFSLRWELKNRRFGLMTSTFRGMTERKYCII